MTSGHAVAIDLTVVIPTVGRQLVHDCLESIAAGDMWPRDLIVVDQGRSLAVASDIARLRRLGLNACHLPSSEIGIASATNRGIARSATVYVAVTHDDCRVAPDWIRRMANRLPQIGEALLSGRVEPSGEGANPTIVTSLVPRVYDAPLPDRDVLFPANMGFPRGIVGSHRDAGRASFLTVYRRGQRVGVPCTSQIYDVYEPDVVVYHVAWRPTRELATILARYAHGRGLLCQVSVAG